MNLHFCRAASVAGVSLLMMGSAPAAQYKFATQTLTVPEGFAIEQVAGPPLIERPISGSFDEQGNLFVTESSGSNDKVDKQLAEKPHRVLRLRAADAQGQFKTRTVFAEHMMFPEGCLWFDGSLYVSAPPSIWKLTDTDADGVADERKEWHEGKTLTGCANDLHGPYLGPDGWIYWCKGAFAKQTYETKGRKPILTRASHIFRAPVDHSDIEFVLTAGMDNPVGVVFSPSGERFMCGTFLMHPEAGKRDGVVHAVYGGVYGKSNDVTDDHKKTGDLMPIMTHLGAAAPCSVIRYEAEAFGPEYRDNLFVCCFNLHKVTRHLLAPDGATFKTTDSDFVTSDNLDFHPTDIIEDADGSLILIDTGGWYKLCCPTSQLSKPDVLGGIYRIRRLGATTAKDPRGLELAWGKMSADQLAVLLSDTRPAVRKRAIHDFANLGPEAIPVLMTQLKSSTPAIRRRNAVWALTRMPSPNARAAVRVALGDRDETVRQAAIHSVSLWRDAAAVPELLSLVQCTNAQLQRPAAEALGRIGDVAAVPVLLSVAAAPHDRVLQHSLIYALIEIGSAAETVKGLAAENQQARCAALIALDQMDNGSLDAQTVASGLGSSEALVRETAAWVAAHHPDWGGALAGFFKERLDAVPLPSAEEQELKQQLARFVSAKPLQELVSTKLLDPAASAQTRNLLLDTIVLASLPEPPAQWTEAVKEDLSSNDPTILESAVAAARVLGQTRKNAPDFSEALLRISLESSCATELRLNALAAMPKGLSVAKPELLNFLCASVDPERPVIERTAAAGVLEKAKLDEAGLLTLAGTLRKAGPLELTKLLGPFERCSSAEVGSSLVEALKNSKGLASVRPDLLQTVFTNYPGPVQEQAMELFRLLDIDTTKQAAHLDDLLSSLKGGDIRRGQAVFNGQKAACSICHAMGYLGGHVGPDLTSIGQSRTERDLLESIVYPSASFVRSYEPYVVRTKSDEDFNGVFKKDAPDEVILATGPGTEVRLSRSEIVEISPSTVSVMPGGMEQQLTHQELADLIAFLKATKWGAN